MIRSFFWSKKWFFWAYGGALLLIASIWVQVQLSVRFNDWYGRFYDILGKALEHTIMDFYASLFEWLYIAIPYILIMTITNFFARHYTFRWRKAITLNYLPRWKNVEQKVEGASQRIQEDAKELGEILESLGLQAVRSIMTVAAFLPVLWKLSEGVKIEMLAGIPGSLVWLALVATIGGMVITWFVGWYLPRLEVHNQVAEAAFRKELVLCEDDRKRRFDNETLFGLFTGVQLNYTKLYLHYGYFDLWIIFYDIGIGLLPDIIMAPNLFTGAITLGVLMQVGNAFQKVWGSFSFLVNNWRSVTRARSVWLRLSTFEANLDKYKLA